jgi:hypothetical protein
MQTTIHRSDNPDDEFPFIITVYGVEHECKIVKDGVKTKFLSSEGEVPVLFSGGYGGAWSADCDQPKPNIMTMQIDPRIMLYRFGGEYEGMKFDDFFKNIIGFQDSPYNGGWKKLNIEFIPEGSLYEITEYDGFESVRVIDINEFSRA